MIKSEGYVNIECLWYWNPAFNSSRGLRPLNNGHDVLQLSKDVVGDDVIYVANGVAEDDTTDPNDVVEDVTNDPNVIIEVQLLKIGTNDPNDVGTTFAPSNIMYPINGPQLWPVDDQNTVAPPLMRKAIGWPKQQRNKTYDEPRNPHILPMKFSTVTYAKYDAMRHNKRSCKGKKAIDRAIPKYSNKPKKAKKMKDGKETKKFKEK
ncbi:hypothetical protein KIW84_046383 [Lathyrus oleraceus]|uniref:Uncharacterized protein n=1 Tax=Pisum sativum TaxID=3888 RepID=A0A9D4XLQ1_PEA|nr:hypothetical protein KIW84_046383 [Pisum sativum]